MVKKLDIDTLCGNYFDKWDLIDLPCVTSSHIFNNDYQIFGSLKKTFDLKSRVLSLNDDGLFSPRLFRTIDYCINSFSIEESKYNKYLIDIFNSELKNENAFIGHCAKIKIDYPYIKNIGIDLLAYIFGISQKSIKNVIFGKEYLMIDSDITDLKKVKLIGFSEYSLTFELQMYSKKCLDKKLIDHVNCIDYFTEILDGLDLNKLLNELLNDDRKNYKWDIDSLIKIVENLIKKSKKASCFITKEIIVLPPKMRPLIYTYVVDDSTSTPIDNKKVYLFLDKLNFDYMELINYSNIGRKDEYNHHLLGGQKKEKLYKKIDELFDKLIKIKYMNIEDFLINSDDESDEDDNDDSLDDNDNY